MNATATTGTNANDSANGSNSMDGVSAPGNTSGMMFSKGFINPEKLKNAAPATLSFMKRNGGK